MDEVVVLEDQSLLDVAIQECGSVEAVFELAVNNDLSVTDTVISGNTIKGATKIKTAIADYFSVHRLRPATTETQTNIEYSRLFGEEFGEEFE